MSKLIELLGIFFNTILKGFASLFGVLQWQQPKWFSAISRRVGVVRQKPMLGLISLLILVSISAGGWFGYQWWQARPKPITIDFTIAAPEKADLEQQEEPHPLVVTFASSVAPLKLIDQDVTEGISISPKIAGHWHWVDDKTLELRPEKEWPVGQTYQVKLEKSFVAPQIELARWNFDLASPVFVSSLEKSEFYQDPQDPALKKAVIQLKFSHPVDTQSLEKNITLTLKNRTEDANQDKKLNFTVSYDKLKLNAFVHSEALPIPTYDQQVLLNLSNDVRAEGSDATNRDTLTAIVAVPSLYSGLTINDVQLNVMPNKQTQQQEQILILNTTMPVHEQKMAQALEVWLLPRDNPKYPNADHTQPYRWTADEVTPEIFNISSRLPAKPIPAEHEFSQTHGFRLQVDVGRQLFVKVNKDIKSFGGYQLAKPDYRTLTVPSYPKEVRILGEGSLLTLSGEKKVALMARDLLGVKVELGRVLPDQLQHLITQSEGDFAHPSFLGDFGQDNLAERFEVAIPLEAQTAGVPNYQPVDLSSYMTDAHGGNKRGVFLLTARNYDPANPDDKSLADTEDKRLILVTDLGIIAKKELDGSQVVFVQSIQTGQPQVNATVEIIGKNGLVLFTGQTDAQGKVRFAELSGLERERQPMFYLVKYQGDLSFLPIDRDDRKLNLSRFAIDGEANAKDENQLNAYLFSDRGIYRPGDTFHIGMMVKTDHWKPLTGIPLEAQITDSRGLVVKESKINLGAGGFNELSYDTLDTSPTGNYTVSLYTVKDGRSDEFLGDTKVKVEEFQPDRIKATATFSQPVSEGWVHPDDLKVTVNVQNLYGTPAEARQVEAKMTLKPALPAFKRYKDFNFFDPHYAKEEFNEDLTPVQTDDKGNAVFALGLEKYTKATYQLRFFARAFEAKGGRNVAAEGNTLVSDMPFLVGYKADGELNFVAKNAVRHAQIIAIDPQVQAMTADKLSLELVERKVLSVLTKQEDNTYKYESRPKEISIHKDSLVIPKEGYNLTLDSATAGDYSYIVRNADGLLLSRIDYSVAGAGNVSRSLDRNAELQLTLDKNSYESGELISVNIRAPYTGAGLITIERDKVYSSVWFKSDTQSSVQHIQVPPELTGNAYVSVQYIRDPSSDEIFMSPLSYGVAPFKISLARHTLDLKLNVPELIKPGENLVMKLQSPEPTRVVVFAVDEGILQAARYENPDPLGHFFKKRQLAVDTTQILDLILPEFKKLMQAAAGGDDQADDNSFLNPFKRKHDKPAVYWSGIVDLVGEKEFTYTVPDTFNGTMRVMAVAVSDSRIASVSNKTLVRGDIIVTPNAPYMIAPGDEFTVSVAVANQLKGSGANATAQISLNVPPQLIIKDEAKKSLVIAEGHEGVVTFKLQAIPPDKIVLGDATLAFTAEIGGKSATIRSEMSVRPATPKINQLRFGSFKGQQDVAIERVLFPQLRQVSAGISALPLVSISGLNALLSGFEHACTEQLASKAMPLLVSIKHPEFFEHNATMPTNADMTRLIAVLRTRQNSEGGFGLWGASPQADDFATVYAVNVLMEAKAQGIAVPEDMFQKTLDYLQTLAASPASDIDTVRVRAYAAYLLTRQGEVTTDILSGLRENLNANFKEDDWRTDLVSVYLASSYQLLKQQNVADELIAAPIKQLLANNSQEDFDFENFYDPLVRDAQTIYLLAKHFPARLRTLPPTIFQTIVRGLTDNRQNTLSSAYLMLAYGAYADVVPPTLVQSMAIAAIDQTGQQQALALPKNFAPRVSFPESSRTLRFSGDSSMPLYYAVSESGFDQLPPTKEVRDGLEITRSYLNVKGETVTKATLGEEISVQIRIRAIDREWINDLVIQDLLPAGFEAVIQAPAANTDEATASDDKASDNSTSNDNAANDAGDEATDNGSAWWKDRLVTGGNWTPFYADVREDRVVLFGTITNQLAEYQYKIKAISEGMFTVPPVYANAMYEPTVRALSGAGKISVEDAVNNAVTAK